MIAPRKKTYIKVRTATMMRYKVFGALQHMKVFVLVLTDRQSVSVV